MSAKNQLSRDQKRWAKLARWGQTKTKAEYEVTPLSGQRYQADAWIPHVHATESAIYEVIQLSGRRLTNDHVKTALTRLAQQLRRGKLATLPADLPEMPFSLDQICEYVIWNIRRFWTDLVARHGTVRGDDFVGILRTLLHSIEARAWHTGPDLGYVAFLEDFLGDGNALRLGIAKPHRVDEGVRVSSGSSLVDFLYRGF